LIEPVITAWKATHPSVSGHQGSYAMREIINAIFYQGRTGCRWDYLPHDLPPHSAVSCYFARWRDDGTDQASAWSAIGSVGAAEARRYAEMIGLAAEMADLIAE
jgi:hypothetical protein